MAFALRRAIPLRSTVSTRAMQRNFASLQVYSDIVELKKNEDIASTRTSAIKTTSPMSIFNNTELTFAAFYIQQSESHQKAPFLLRGIADEAAQRTSEFRSQDLVELCACFHEANVTHPVFFRAVARELASRLEELLSHHITILAEIMAAEGIEDKGLFDAIANRIAPVIARQFPTQCEFDGSQLSIIVSAFTSAKMNNKTFADALCADFTAHPLRYEPEHMDVIKHFITENGRVTPAFLRTLQTLPTLSKYNEQAADAANEDHDSTSAIYNMRVADAYGAPHRLKPRKFVLTSEA